MHFNADFLFLADTMSLGLSIGLICAAAVIFAFIGVLVGKVVSDKSRSKKIADTETIIAKMKEDAEQECKAIKKAAVLEAKEEDLKIRNDFERESREKRSELQRMEQRLNQKDELLAKKDANLLKKNEEIEQMKRDLDRKHTEVAKVKEKLDKQSEVMMAELEKVAQLTKEEAKAQIMEATVEEARKDCAATVRNMEAEAKEEGEKKAKDIISLAIQRCCTDHASEITVTTIALPNEDMKARIIGREGRNIRALENATGI